MEEKSWTVKQLENVFEWFLSLDLFSKIATWLSAEIVALTSYLSAIFLSLPVFFLTSKPFNFIYNLIFTFSTSVALIIVLYHAFLIGLNKNTIDDYMTFLFKLMFLPIFTHFAPEIVIIFITLTNKLTANILNVVQTIQPSGELNLFNSAILGLAQIVFLVLFVFYLFKIFLHYARRNFRILELVVYAPFIYLISCMPKYNDKLNLLIHEIASLLITQIVHSIEFLILSSLTLLAGENLGVFITQIGALICMNESINLVEKYITPKNTSFGLAKNREIISQNIQKYKDKAKIKFISKVKGLYKKYKGGS